METSCHSVGLDRVTNINIAAIWITASDIQKDPKPEIVLLVMFDN